MAAVLREAPAAHVLVVDDDLAVRQLVSEYLAQNDFRVSAAASGAELMGAFRAQVVDLVLLDLRLQGEDGMQLLQQLRAESQLPVIILTGRTEEADRVMGLELGADDYLTKPFSPRELLARIRTVLRRTHAGQVVHGAPVCRAYRIPGWELNLRTRKLRARDGRVLALSNGEFNLLAALLATANRVVTRDQLIEMSRRYDNEVYDRAIDVQILRLRRKIESDPAQPQIILTERGAGYRLGVAVEAVY
ncbi:MAG: response regulator transcription factor [Gammaproteobacteria bacterium]|nr:MAG: response regulator transcription factor [Gammaproteobacteria bacterium]TLY86540.1 MAG: response regulator transcription factor [Gammaproteobacteria bacterium]